MFISLSLSSTTHLNSQSTLHRSCKTLVPPRLSWGSRPRLLVSHWSRHPLPLAPFRDHNAILQVREPGWKSRQACCISPVGMFHHMDRAPSWRSSQSRTWSISRIGRWYLGPVEVVLYSTVFNLLLCHQSHTIQIIRTPNCRKPIITTNITLRWPPGTTVIPSQPFDS